MGFLKLLMAFKELKPLLWSDPNNSFSNLGERLYSVYARSRGKQRAICKVTKIQHVKLHTLLGRQCGLEGLIVETDVGCDGRPVPSSSLNNTGLGGGERFLILRTRDASTRVLEDVISSMNEDQKTKQVARWIEDLVRDEHPAPRPDDYRLGKPVSEWDNSK